MLIIIHYFCGIEEKVKCTSSSFDEIISEGRASTREGTCERWLCGSLRFNAQQ